MSDNEIVKALECCGKSSCKGCPYLNKFPCNEFFPKDALDLINRQKAEMERLNELLEIRHKVFETKCEELEVAKAEAYKEFAERLKASIYSKYDEVLYAYEIDNLLKEMVGEG
jgi:hypothetical protein